MTKGDTQGVYVMYESIQGVYVIQLTVQKIEKSENLKI